MLEMKFRRSKSETCSGLLPAVSSSHRWQMGTRRSAFSIHRQKQGRLCFPHFGSEAKTAISRDEPGPLAGSVCGALSGLGLQCMLAASQPHRGPGDDALGFLPRRRGGWVGGRRGGSRLLGHYALPSFRMRPERAARAAPRPSAAPRCWGHEAVPTGAPSTCRPAS